MKRITFTAGSTAEIAIEHYMKDYEQKHGKKMHEVLCHQCLDQHGRYPANYVQE